MKNSLLVKLWIFLKEAVIHALLLSLHLKCFLFVFASRFWWHALPSIFTSMIRLLGRFVNEVAKTFFICAGLPWYDGIHFSYLSEYQLYLTHTQKGLVTISGVSGFCLLYLFTSTTLNSGGFLLKYTHYFQFKLCTFDNRYWTIILIYMYTHHKM